MEEMAEKTPKSRRRDGKVKGTPKCKRGSVKRKLDFSETPENAAKKAKLDPAVTPLSTAAKDELSESGSDDDDDGDLFRDKFARVKVAATPSPASATKAKEEVEGGSGDEAETPIIKNHATKENPDENNNDEEKPEATIPPIDDLLLTLLPASQSKLLGFIHSKLTDTASTQRRQALRFLSMSQN